MRRTQPEVRLAQTVASLAGPPGCSKPSSSSARSSARATSPSSPPPSRSSATDGATSRAVILRTSMRPMARIAVADLGHDLGDLRAGGEHHRDVGPPQSVRRHPCGQRRQVSQRPAFVGPPDGRLYHARALMSSLSRRLPDRVGKKGSRALERQATPARACVGFPSGALRSSVSCGFARLLGRCGPGLRRAKAAWPSAWGHAWAGLEREEGAQRPAEFAALPRTRSGTFGRKDVRGRYTPRSTAMRCSSAASVNSA